MTVWSPLCKAIRGPTQFGDRNAPTLISTAAGPSGPTWVAVIGQRNSHSPGSLFVTVLQAAVVSVVSPRPISMFEAASGQNW